MLKAEREGRFSMMLVMCLAILGTAVGMALLWMKIADSDAARPKVPGVDEESQAEPDEAPLNQWRNPGA